MLILSLTHTHTHTLQTHALSVMVWCNEKKENDRSARRREEVGFSVSDLRQGSEDYSSKYYDKPGPLAARRSSRTG